MATEAAERRPKYDIFVPLLGHDGNAFAIIGRTMYALRKAGVEREEIEKFRIEAESGDYDNVLRTVMRWVDTDPDSDHGLGG